MTSQTPSSTITHKINLISKAFHWKQNRLEIMQHIKNSRGNSINHFPPLYHGGGMTLRVHPRVNGVDVNPLSSPPNFPCSTNQTLFDFFLKGGEKRIKRKQWSPGWSLQLSAAHGMLYSLPYDIYTFVSLTVIHVLSFLAFFLRLNVWSHGFLQHNRAQSRLLSIC